jgi:Flp pilus assembly protein TadD
MTNDFERAREAFFAGLRAFEAGRFDEARARFEEALALVPGRPPPW